ncbi:MAG: fimbrial biogenesis outer membrane usher protein [Betaproteobacteria bacterium]|nr:fimbrial biogenesis outer membrane usher protein [Betaproteobacteria bacterium]
MAAAAALAGCSLALVAGNVSARTTPEKKPAANAPAVNTLMAEVRLDGRPAGSWTFVDRNGTLFAPERLFSDLKLVRRSDAKPIVMLGQNWFSIAAVPALEVVHYFREKVIELRRPGVAAAAPSASVAAPKPAQIAFPAPVVTPVAPSAPPRPTPTADAQRARFLPLDVTINGAKTGNWLLMEKNGVLYAPEDAFEEWRVNRRPDSVPVQERGQTWFALTAIPGFQSQLDVANQALDLKFQAAAFAATRVTTEREQRHAVTPATPAAWLNYDLSQNFSHTQGLTGTRDLGALLEVGVSSELGVLTSAHAGRGLFGNAAPGNWRRLETTFVRDFPSGDVTFKLGDTTTRAGTLGRSTYFGGLQLSRNFGFSPGFIAQPIPSIAGQASAPSTVELYVNDSLRQTSKVPTGPFVLDNFPLLTGSGQARVVVRDVLGRETVLVQNFFSHGDLLAKGLTDWSLDAGAVRRNLGTENAAYGQRFGSIVVRHGFTDDFTLEGHVEGGRESRGAGAVANVALPGQLLGQAGFAVSDDKTVGQGSQWTLGIEHSSLRHGFTVRAEGSTRAYRLLGQGSNTLGYSRQLAASYTYSSERLGHMGLGYARIDSFDQGLLSTYSANYSLQLSRSFSVSVFATRVNGRSSSESVGVSVTLPLEGTRAATANATHRAGQTDGYASVSQPLGNESGTGWRALAGSRAGDALVEGGVYVQGGYGQASVDASASRPQKAVRLGVQGGLVLIDKRVFLSRRIQESFALVEVPGYADVGVGFQSSKFARTGADGSALITRLLPYRRNAIRLDPSELPINAELDSIEQIAVPGYRTGVKVTFPVREGRGALIRILFDDNDVAPPGAELKLEGDKQEFFVARRGEAFVTGLKDRNVLRLNWNGKSCDMAVVLPPGKPDEIARVGPVMCRGVPRE